MAKLLSGTRVYGNAAVDGTLTIGGTVQADKIVTNSIPLVLNDISDQFDAAKQVFPLRYDQTDVTNNNITDSKNLEVIVGGLRLSPYVKQNTFPWLTPYDSHKGFRVVATATSANIIIYNAPAIGDQAVLTITNSSLTAQIRRYPYCATTIALGD
jgi:hypothetical protein